MKLTVKKLFFDRDVVIRAMDDATRRALSKAGAFVRTAAQSSMRSRKKASEPGKPPSAHGNPLLKRLLFFSYDPSSKSVVVGPTPFGKGNAPELNEFGGSTTIVSHGRTVDAKYPARPFMGPALEREVDQLPSRWSGTLRH